MSNTILTPGYVRWTGTAFVTDPTVEIVGPAGADGADGPPGPAGSAGLPGVDNIAALKSFSLPSNHMGISVKGYYVPGDGGQGDFYWDASSSDADNSGTIIALNIGGIGRWKRIYSGTISVKWFGAISEPILSYAPTIQKATNNTTAINAAITLAKTSGLGGEVYIPQGLYFVNGTISLNGSATAPSGSGITIHGERPRYFFDNLSAIQFVGTWLAWYNPININIDTGPMISMFDTQDLSFEKIGLWGGSSATTMVGIKIYSDNAPATFGLHFSDFFLLSMGVGIDWGDGLNTHQADRVIMDHFTIASCTIGIRVNGGNAGDFSEIRSGVFNLCTVAIDLLVAGSIKITSCSAGGNPGFAFIRCSGIHTQLIVENSQAEEGTGDGYFFYIPKNSISYPTTSNDATAIIFIGNTINTIVEINTIQRIVGMGNIYENENAPPNLIRLWCDGVKYMGWGDRIMVPTTVSMFDGNTTFYASFHNQRGTYASTFGETVIAGEIIWSNSSNPISPSNIGSLVTTSGITGSGAVVQAFSVNYTGAGSPNGNIIASVGSIYTRTDGGANTTLYVKESGNGNTGWVPK